MARSVVDTRLTKKNPANPELMGESIVPLAWEAVGVGIAAAGSSQLVMPLAHQIVPGGLSKGVAGGLVDAFATALTGWLAGQAAGMVDSRVGRYIQHGGVLLGVAKAIGAFLPGFSISASIPGAGLIPSLNAPKASQPAPTSNPALAAVGSKSMGL